MELEIQDKQDLELTGLLVMEEQQEMVEVVVTGEMQKLMEEQILMVEEVDLSGVIQEQENLVE
jgi:hypothetical protein